MDVQGAQGKLAFGASSGAIDKRIQFLRESLTLNSNIYSPDGINGTRDHLDERTGENIRHVSGGWDCEPNPAELSWMLPYILGGTPSGTNYPLAEALSSFAVAVDRVAKVFTYVGLYISTATFKASVGGALSLSIEVMGEDESIGNAGTFPSLNLNVANGRPFMLRDLAVTVGGTAYPFMDWTMTINNMLEMRHSGGSLTPTSITPRDRSITVALESPYGDAYALYGVQLPGAAVIATFTSGSQSLVFNTPALQYPKKTPNISGKNAIRMPIQGTAYKKSASATLVTTLTVTP